MKILLSAYACKPNFGSEEGRGWNLSFHLAQLGHQVWVLTLADNQQTIEQELAIRPVSNLHFIYIRVPELIKRYVKFPIGDFSWQSDYLAWQLRAYNIAKKLDQEQEFDIVHHITWGSITAGSWLWRLNKTFVFGPVGGGQVAPPAFKQYFQDQWQKEGLRSFLFQKLAKFNFLSRQTISQADLILTTNRDTYDLAQKLSAQRVEMFLTCGLPEDYFSQNIPTKPNSRVHADKSSVLPHGANRITFVSEDGASDIKAAGNPQPRALANAPASRSDFDTVASVDRSSTSPELRLLWVGRFSMRKGLRLTLESLSKVSHLIPVKMTIVGVSGANHYLKKWLKEFGL
ncbi:MAG: glycosyltransferase [Cyanobacteria bacterium J06642_3]